MIYKPHKSIFINASTLIIAGTGTGKTATIKYILKLINDDDTRAYAFLGENSELRSYVYENGDLGGSDLLNPLSLKNIYKKQVKLRKIKCLIYKHKNRILSLIKGKSILIYKKIRKAMKKINERDPEDLKMEMTILILRSAVRAAFMSIDGLYGDDKNLISICLMKGYKALIIIDDLTGELETICKKKEMKLVLTDLLTKSRHFGTTILVAVHNPISINSMFRNNAKNIIWCSQMEYINSMGTTHYPKIQMKKKQGNLFKLKYDKAIFSKFTDEIGTLRFDLEDMTLPDKIGISIPVRPVELVEEENDLSIEDLRKIYDGSTTQEY